MVREAVLQVLGRPRFWAVAVMGWSGVIFLLSGWQDPPTPTAIEGAGASRSWGVAGHFFMYWVLAMMGYGLLLSWSSARGRRGHGYAVFLVPVVLAIAYGGAMELYQATVPGRAPSWEDVGVNAGGAMAGVGGGYLVKRVVPRWVWSRAPKE